MEGGGRWLSGGRGEVVKWREGGRWLSGGRGEVVKWREG